MSGGGVSDDDMPNFPWSSRGEVPPVGDPAYDALLDGDPGAAERLRPVAETLAALNAGPAGRELAAEARARAVFRAGSRSGEPARPRPRRRRVVGRLAVVTGTAVTLGGAAAAAYAGVLPAPAQNVAHHVLGAPAAHQLGRPKVTPPPGPAKTAHPGTAPSGGPDGGSGGQVPAHQKGNGAAGDGVFKSHGSGSSAGHGSSGGGSSGPGGGGMSQFPAGGNGNSQPRGNGNAGQPGVSPGNGRHGPKDTPSPPPASPPATQPTQPTATPATDPTPTATLEAAARSRPPRP
jgi:hypothetical protein